MQGGQSRSGYISRGSEIGEKPETIQAEGSRGGHKMIEAGGGGWPGTMLGGGSKGGYERGGPDGG